MKTTFNKLMAWALTFAMLMSFMPSVLVSADAAEDLADDATGITLKDTDLDGYYEIGTADELMAFANLVNGGEDSINIELVKNIDMTDKQWSTVIFGGEINGNGHSISNLEMIETDMGAYLAGLIYSVGATVKNLYFEECSAVISSNAVADGDCYAGIIAAAAEGITVENCSAIECIVKQEGTVSNMSYAGGLLGGANGPVYFKECSFQGGSITATTDSWPSYAGGIAAGVWDYGDGVGVTMIDSFCSGDISVTNSASGHAGGIIGLEQNEYGTEAHVYDNCYFSGTIDSVGCAAGLIGDCCAGDATVSNCAVFSDKIEATYGDPFVYGEWAQKGEHTYYTMTYTDLVICEDTEFVLAQSTSLPNNYYLSDLYLNDTWDSAVDTITSAEAATYTVEGFKSNLYGALEDETENVTITLLQNNQPVYTAVTDADGEYNFGKNVLPGEYSLEIEEGNGYFSYSDEITIAYAANTKKDIKREAMVYTVEFNSNGGEGTMADQTIYVNAETALSENAFNREGYNFDGWATEVSGSVQYDDEESVNNIADAGESITLYAVWSKIPATAPSVTASQGLNLVYGEITSDDKISVTATAADDTDYDLTYQWYKGEDGINEATSASYIIPADTTVGLYSYYCEVTATRRDNGDAASVKSESISVDVAKASIAIPTVSPKVYTGEALTADIEETDDYSVTTNEGGTDVGEYDVVLTLKDSVNCKWADSDDVTKTIKFEIVQSGTSFTTNKLLKGEEETTEFIYGDTITVKIKPQATGEAATVTTMSLTPPIENQMALYYDDTQITDATSADSEGYYTMTVDTTTAGLDYGEITITAKYVGNSNMADCAESITLTLAKADSSFETAPAAITSLVYNKEEQVLVNAGIGMVGGTLKYKLNDGEYSEELPKAKNADTYTIYYKIFGDANHNDTEEQSFEVSIAEKTINPVIALDEPVASMTPVTSIDTEEYTADVVWSPSVDNKFEYNTEYTAVITILPKANYTLMGILENEYTVEGAEVTNEADSDTVTAVFEKTNKKPTTVAGGGFFGGGVAAGAKKTTVKEVDWANPFTDVDEDDWFYGDVRFVSENKLMNGTANSMFTPDEFITRAMLVTILYRAEDEPDVTEKATFADVQAGAYYEDAVAWAQANGIVKGYSDTEFAPGDNVTREQIAAIMYRYAQYKGYDVSVGEDTNILSYEDYAAIEEYAVSAIQYAVGGGLMKGKTASTFNPQDFATRAEIAAIFHRLMK